MAALRRHSNNEGVARKGFRAINCLTSNPGNAAWLGPTGACEAVLQAIERHIGSPLMVALGLETVSCLATDEGQ